MKNISNYVKDFDKWAIKKKEIDSKKINVKIKKEIFFHERETWWVSVGINIGVEVDGKNEDFERPVLILKWINKNQFLGITLTSSNKGYFYKKLKYNENSKDIFVNISQLKVFSSKRLLRKIAEFCKNEWQMQCTMLQYSMYIPKPARVLQ